MAKKKVRAPIERGTIFSIYGLATDAKYRVIVAIPFDINLSKNKAKMLTRQGKMYTPAQHKAAKAHLLRVLSEACKDHAWKKQTKYWMAIHVQKPNNRSDAPNFVDAIADVIKLAIGVDDCWMEIEKVTYEVIKDRTDLKIFVSVSQ